MKNQIARAENYDDDAEFDRYDKIVNEIQANLDAINIKLDKSTRDFEREKAAKEARDLEEGTAAAEAEFATRSGERKAQFDTLDGLLTTAKDNLKGNLDEIARLEGLLEDDADNQTLKDEKAAAEG